MGKNKTLFRQGIDVNTGEIVTIEHTYVTDNTETFLMARTTDRPNWIADLSGVEIKLFFALAYFCNPKIDLVDFSSSFIDIYCKFTGCKKQSLSNALASLCKKDYVVKVSKGKYFLYPYLYLGKSNSVNERINKFNNYKQQNNGK